MAESQLLPWQQNIYDAVLEQLSKGELVNLKMPHGYGRMFITGIIIRNYFKKVVICGNNNMCLIDAKSTLSKICSEFNMDTTEGEKWIAFCYGPKFNRNNYPECELFVGINLKYTPNCFSNTLSIESGLKCMVNGVEKSITNL